MAKPTKDNPTYVRGVGHVYVDDEDYIMTTDGKQLGRIVKGKIKLEGLGGTEYARVRAALGKSARSKTINVTVTKDKKGNPNVHAASKADEKRIAKQLKALKGKEVVALVENDHELRFLDLSMKNDPVLASAVYGGLGSLVGMVPGVLLMSPVGIWLGWTAGGALGARAGAPANRKFKSAWGGGIGGAIGGPVGAALGGALGARKKEINTKQLKNKLLR